jgi:hypothetical protein
MRAKRARPVGPADRPSSTLLPGVGRRRRPIDGLNQPDGLLRSVAGQGDGRFLPVTLPRGASDQRKRARAGASRSPTPGGTRQGRDQGGDRGTHPGGETRGREIGVDGSGPLLTITLGNSPTGTARRPKSASARPGPAPGRVRPMPSPGGNYHPARRRPASRSFVLGRRRRPPGTAPGANWRPAGAPP